MQGELTPVEHAWLWHSKAGVEGQRRAETVVLLDGRLLSHVCFVYVSPVSVICSLSDITFRQEYQKKPCYKMSLSGLERIPRFNSQHLPTHTQESVTPVPRDSIPASGLCGHQAHKWYTDICGCERLFM